MSSPLGNLRPFSAFTIFLLLWLSCVIAFAGLSLLGGLVIYGKELTSAGADAITMEGGIEWLRFSQLLNQFGVFLLPSFLFAILIYGGKDFIRGLGMREKSPASIWGISILLLLASIPLVNMLAVWNMSIHLPESLAGVEQWMRQQEETAQALSEAFLKTSSLNGLLMNILILAILPAFGEELLFRGSLQPLFIRWTGNNHIGVFISAVAFSALHIQFFGFFPRAFLGLVLGYAFLWTRNLWVPMLMHFLNNLTIVLVSWMSAGELIEMEDESLQTFSPVWSIIVSLLLLYTSAMYLKKYFRREPNP